MSVLFRLVILVAGGSLAWWLGVAIAFFYPRSTPSMPLTVKLGRSLNSLLPQERSRPNASTQTTPLTSAQREKLQAELIQLRLQLQELRIRTTALESQINRSHSDQALETRLGAIAEELGVPAENLTEPSLSDDGLMITLPSDSLFPANETVLLPQNQVILDSVIAELQKYRGARIFIAAHTDSADEESGNRARSFRRAEAVQQYLASQLGDGYDWVAIGYGESRPLVPNNTDANRQRNRRIEIAIDQ